LEWVGVNGKEKFAGIILVLTLAVGVVADIISQDGWYGRVACKPEQEQPTSGELSDGGYRKVNVNAASRDDLEVLPGIGPKKAQALVEWRDQNGPFKRPGDLLKVRGIGQQTLERISPYITIAEPETLWTD
jgi:competence protein ComEA